MSSIHLLYLLRLPKNVQTYLMDVMPFLFAECIKWLIHFTIQDHGIDLNDKGTDLLVS